MCLFKNLELLFLKSNMKSSLNILCFYILQKSKFKNQNFDYYNCYNWLSTCCSLKCTVWSTYFFPNTDWFLFLTLSLTVDLLFPPFPPLLLLLAFETTDWFRCFPPPPPPRDAKRCFALRAAVTWPVFA